MKEKNFFLEVLFLASFLCLGYFIVGSLVTIERNSLLSRNIESLFFVLAFILAPLSIWKKTLTFWSRWYEKKEPIYYAYFKLTECIVFDTSLLVFITYLALDRISPLSIPNLAIKIIAVVIGIPFLYICLRKQKQKGKDYAHKNPAI